MADQLFLSYEIRGFHTLNMLRAWEKMLRLFPYSKLTGTPATLKVHAVRYQEPLLREQAFNPPPDIEAVLKVAREVLADDCAYVLDASWDLWRFEEEWKVLPTRISLGCFGPKFESETEENLRIDFGPDIHFLPQPDIAGSVQMVQSNLKSLLHLVHTLDDALPVEHRRLWTESGENFAERLQAIL